MRRLILAFLIIGTGARAEMFDDGFKPCGDRNSTAETVDCVGAKIKPLDRRLNAAYAALLKAADDRQKEPLRKAQRLWIQYRDANCDFYAAGDGTISRIKAVECLRSMTADRAQELEQAAQP